MKEGFYLWIFRAVSELARGLAAALGTMCTFSQPCPRYYYCYWEGGGIWHWRAEDCGAVMAEMARPAHFTPPSEWLQISCTAVLIGNTLETSFHDHTYGSQKKEKWKKGGSKKEVQNMTKCTELTLDLSLFLTSIFPALIKSEMCWVKVKTAQRS